jgi:hypothetical protein
MKIDRDYKPEPRNIRHVPYNTGRVKIGLSYLPPPRDYTTPDNERLQQRLLGVAPAQSKNYAGWCVYLFAVIVVSMAAVALAS